MKRWPVLILLALTLAACTGRIPEFTFETAHAGMSGSMRGLHVLTDKIIWISGSGGEVSCSADGGLSWARNLVQGAESLDFRDVHAFSESKALVMSIGPGSQSRIYLTTDVGMNWELVLMNQDSLAFFDGFDFFDENHGVLIGDPVDSKPYLLETRDGGRSWNRMDTSAMPDLIPGEYAFAASGSSLDLLPDGQIWFVTGGSVARVFYSPDRGKSWNVTATDVLQGDPAAGLFSVAVLNRTRVAAVGGHYKQMELSGSNVLISDSDNGNFYIPEGAAGVTFMESVRWINTKELLATGPTGVFYSRQGGDEWIRIADEGGHALDISALNKVGWIVGNKGKVSKFVW